MFFRRQLSLISLAFILSLSSVSWATDFRAFKARINTDKINIRVDSTVNSSIICAARKGEEVEVVGEFYGWSKIRLPGRAPAYIKKNFIEITLSENAPVAPPPELASLPVKKAKVAKDKVNIRLEPSESSPIIGKANQAETVDIVKEGTGWYRIEPTANCFGWILTKFVNKIGNPALGLEPMPSPVAAVKPEGPGPLILKGIVKPCGFLAKKISTHKLLTKDNQIFFLKAQKEKLNSFNYKRVKLSGKIIGSSPDNHPVIEVADLEFAP